MTKVIILLAALIVSVTFVSAQSMTLTVGDNDVFVEVLFTKDASFMLPADYANLEIQNTHMVKETTLLVEGFGIFNFTSKSFLTKSGGSMIVLVPVLSNETLSAKVILPPGTIIVDDLVFPKDYTITTNGKNIIVNWDDVGGREIIVFYEDVSKLPTLVYIVGVLVFIIFIILYRLQQKKFKQKQGELKDLQTKRMRAPRRPLREAVTHNLFGDEKKIVEYLLSKKGRSSWTKNMVKDLDISKVRLSRKLRSLAEKGLIRKEPHGNENRIYLIKRK